MGHPHDSTPQDGFTPTREDVARRAYELFEARGGAPGHDLDNWLEAERELTPTAQSTVHESLNGTQRDTDR